MTNLAVRYKRAAHAPSDVKDHLPTFVEVVESRNAQKVIELGVRGGVSTIAWLYALEHTGGHLWSVDIDPRPSRVGRYPHWTFIVGDDCAPAVLDQLPTEVDAVFVDTSHAYAHTLRELELFVPRVRSGGCVLLHDTNLEVADLDNLTDPYPVRRALDDFCAVSGLSWSENPACFGLGRIDIA